jgi:uncharacterized membrane protein YeiH
MNVVVQYLQHLLQYLQPGNFVLIDLLAATTNALNGALLAQRPDYYRRNYWTIVGLLLMAVTGGIAGGVIRDVLLNKIPYALTNPWYLFLCLLAGVVGILIAYGKGQKFRETFFQFMTSFSLTWYAVVGVQAALNAKLPWIACIAIGVVGPTAGPYFIDLTAGRPAQQFVQGEWFVGAAVLTSIVYLVCAQWLHLSLYPASLIAFVIGFCFRVAALWFKWEEPMPRLPPDLLKGKTQRESLKEKMEPGWEPEE